MRPEPLESYTWPPSSESIAERVGIDPRDVIRFDGNVPADPLSVARPATIARALADINEYDRGRYEPLRGAIAARHGRSIDEVTLGAGSDELIVLCARLFAEGGTVATVPATSYSMYRYAAIMAGARLVDDPGAADLVFVCRPNNPTGELPDVPNVSGQLVIDEAYADYAGVDALEWIDRGAIVLRTFSKAFGLAGARVGYALGAAPLIAALSSRQAPLSVSSLSAALALAALASPPDVGPQIAERERLADGLRALGLSPVPSYTNFLYVPMEEPSRLVEDLLPYGVVTRAFRGGWRVSVRDREDDDRLLAALAAVRTGAPEPTRVVRQQRATAETRFRVRLRVPGEGRVHVESGEGFYDHMLQQLAFHGGLDLRVEGVGDPETGDHHTVEDMFRTVGAALDRALGDRRGLARYGEARVPMDEAQAHAVIDLSGRPVAVIDIDPDPGMAAHALESLVQTARVTLHVTAHGRNAHHVAEAAFKAVGRALAAALAPRGTMVNSTKGSL